MENKQMTTLIERYNAAIELFNKTKTQMETNFSQVEALIVELENIEVQIIEAEQQVENKIARIEELTKSQVEKLSKLPTSEEVINNINERKPYLEQLNSILSGDDIDIKTSDRQHDIRTEDQKTPDLVANLNSALANSPSDVELSDELPQQEYDPSMDERLDEISLEFLTKHFGISLIGDKLTNNQVGTIKTSMARLYEKDHVACASLYSKFLNICNGVLTEAQKADINSSPLEITLADDSNSTVTTLRSQWSEYFGTATFFIDRLGNSNKITGETQSLIEKTALDKNDAGIIDFVIENFSKYMYPNYIKDLNAVKVKILDEEMPF